MKKILFLVVFALSNVINAQINNGYIIYSVIPIENGSGFEKLLLEQNQNLFNKAREIDFTLLFDNKSSFFDINKNFKNDSSEETTFAKIKINYEGTVFQNKDSVFTNLNSSYLGGKLIVKKPIENKWTLTNETKMIDDFLCYKATTQIILVRPNKTFINPITAWYCPKINIPFGPFGYGNLPGLILELQTKDAIFGVAKMVFNPENKIEIPKKNVKDKVISEEEFSQVIENYNNEKKDKN